MVAPLSYPDPVTILKGDDPVLIHVNTALTHLGDYLAAQQEIWYQIAFFIAARGITLTHRAHGRKIGG